MSQNFQDYAVLHLARVTLEAVTPLSISTGSPDNVFDTALVRDANGLPALPGSALAGVLRHLWVSTHGEDSANELFGYQKGNDAQRSRLTVSWGALLDSNGQAAEGLFLGDRQSRLYDDLYAKVLEQIDDPVFRDRVRLSHKGAAANTGKFDRAVLPAGNRFALELRVWSDSADEPHWPQLLHLFAHPGFRLGGATRAGLGRMRCHSVHERRFDLRQAADREVFVSLSREMTNPKDLQEFTPRLTTGTWLSGTLHLRATGLWRIGQGSRALSQDGEKPADLLPQIEQSVLWQNGKGKCGPDRILLPGSSLKGALAHRMSFHARRFSSQWCPDGGPVDEDTERLPASVCALLGEVKAKTGDGQAGALFIDDATLPIPEKKIARLMHNAIDRFTGGVRDHMLFEEESIFGGELSIAIALDSNRLPSDEIGTIRQILGASLDDLCQGRLALGSRTSTGNGFFSGRLEGPLAEWLHANNDGEEAA